MLPLSHGCFPDDHPGIYAVWQPGTFTYFLQTLLGYPALKAAIAMFPRGLVFLLLLPLLILMKRPSHKGGAAGMD